MVIKMKKSVLLFIVFALVTFAGCSNIAYTPRGVPLDTTNGKDTTQSNPDAINDKYKLIRFDLTPKPFEWNFNPIDPYIISSVGQNQSFTVSKEFNSPQHYRIGIKALPLAGNPVVSLSSGGETFGVFHITDNSEQTQQDDETAPPNDLYFIEPVYFPAGVAELTFTALRGSVRVEAITAINTSFIPPERFHTPVQLCSPNASAETIVVFDYLKNQFGHKMLTAQHCTVNTNAEIDAVFNTTGRYPAVRFGEADGFLSSPQEIELAKQWHNKGGIVGFTWYWKPLVVGVRGSVYASETGFSLSQAVRGIDSGVALMDIDFIQTLVETGEVSASCMQVIRDIDEVAEALAQLARENIPVLFNPLPDGGSRLYWWGSSETPGEDYISLWRLMYERMTHYHQLNNLIWSFSGGDYKFYPGDNYVDIIGESVFPRTPDSSDSTAPERIQPGSEVVSLGHTSLYAHVRREKPAMVVA